MEKIIKAAVDRGASDLHIKAGDVFRARIDGKLIALTRQALTPEQTKAIALRLIQNEQARRDIDSLCDYDCSWGATGHRPLPREHPAAAVQLHDRDARHPDRDPERSSRCACRRCSRRWRRRSAAWCW